MDVRTIGPLTVSAIGLGCMTMSQAYGVRDDAESLRTLDRALDLGITFFDTADAYGQGANERLVAQGLGSRRAKVVLASKCGIVRQPDGTNGVNGDPGYIRAACDGSLARLKTDVIDLYYLHRVDPRVPIEDSVGALVELKKEGKVRAIGLSEAAPSTIRRAHAVHPIAALQSEYSLWFREPEQTVIPVCRELGITFVPFSPLGRGFLARQVLSLDDLPKDDLRRRIPRFQGEHFTQNMTVLDRFTALAEQKRSTPAKLSLAWLLAKGGDLVPIPGTKHVAYVEEDAAAAEVTLSAADIAQLDDLFKPGAISGNRYPPEMERLIDRSS